MSIENSFTQPSTAAQVINNSYTYNTSATSGSADSTQEIVINAQFIVGEEVVAEGVIDTIVDEIDERQGLKIELKKRGL